MQADFLIIGSGIAALRAAAALEGVGDVLVLTKAGPRAGNTGYAQGGIAAAVGPDDSPARILEIITPSGLEEMFAKFGELGARGELTPETMGATAAQYGSTMSMDWVRDLVRRYGLTLLGS